MTIKEQSKREIKAFYPGEVILVKTDRDVGLALHQRILEEGNSAIYRAKTLDNKSNYPDNQTDFVVKMPSGLLTTPSNDGELFTRLMYEQEAFLFREFPKVSKKFARYFPKFYDTIGFCTRKTLPGIVVEELHGEDLLDKNHNLVENIETLIEVGTVIEEMHKNGFIHRDIKEGNIKFRNPHVPGEQISGLVLTDGGFAYHKNSYTMRAFLKDPGAIGTIPYMDENAAAGYINPSSDRYAFGVMIKHLLTKEGFQADLDSNELSTRLIRSRQYIPNEISRDIPHLDELLFKMFNPKMSLRPKLEDVLGVLQQIHTDFSGKPYTPEYLRQAS